MGLRVAIIDSVDLVRIGIRAILKSTSADFKIICEAAECSDSLASVFGDYADIYVVHVAAVPQGAIRFVEELRKGAPAASVIFLGNSRSLNAISDCLRFPGTAYLLRSSAGAELLSAIEALVAGKHYVSTDISNVLIRHFVSKQQDMAPFQGVSHTQRERAILRLVASGKTEKEISTILGISTSTVHTHKSKVMKRLDLHSSASLVRYAIESGLLDPE